MKKNKAVIIICIFLIIIIIGQIVYFKIFNNNSDTIESDMQTEQGQGIIANIEELYNYFPHLPISDKVLNEKVYNLIMQDFPRIHEMTKDNTAHQNKEIYIENQNEISQMGIHSSNDFILIAEELRVALENENTVVTSVRASVDDSNLLDSKNYYFNLTIVYDNNNKSEIKCIIPISTNISKTKVDNSELSFASNSKIAQILEKNNINIAVEDIITTISNFTLNIKTVCKANELKGESKLAQYYDVGKSELNKMGIYSSQDMQNILKTISNNIDWNKQGDINYYISDDAKEVDNYKVFQFAIVYGFNDRAIINLEISSKANVIPSVKYTGNE